MGNTLQTSVDYQRLSLTSLLGRVVDLSDQAALREFHDRRTPFRKGEGERLRLAEYVMALREDCLRIRPRPGAPGDEILDRTYELVIERFSHFPDGSRQRQIDCRLYYRVFLRKFSQVEAGRKGS